MKGGPLLPTLWYLRRTEIGDELLRDRMALRVPVEEPEEQRPPRTWRLRDQHCRLIYWHSFRDPGGAKARVLGVPVGRFARLTRLPGRKRAKRALVERRRAQRVGKV